MKTVRTSKLVERVEMKAEIKINVDSGQMEWAINEDLNLQQ
jgi:hypothetical protein